MSNSEGLASLANAGNIKQTKIIPKLIFILQQSSCSYIIHLSIKLNNLVGLLRNHIFSMKVQKYRKALLDE